ncbi:hypothetical protein ITJ44_15655 [Clavibacter sp. VKM Ac-2873]|uniref:hypothetical protein n=1 Tax=Clavibacter sp. VKM Ac-2873 TaxID=2783813 RepID=UPI00188B5F4B|nr:hypothetical protein [Clavibacter sp. VKM Ac-2873]MBF4619511.1 hypothetical protein [Clavibacter sp. VKM Ac-2873]
MKPIDDRPPRSSRLVQLAIGLGLVYALCLLAILCGMETLVGTGLPGRPGSPRGFIPITIGLVGLFVVIAGVNVHDHLAHPSAPIRSSACAEPQDGPDGHQLAPSIPSSVIASALAVGVLVAHAGGTLLFPSTPGLKVLQSEIPPALAIGAGLFCAVMVLTATTRVRVGSGATGRSEAGR